MHTINLINSIKIACFKFLPIQPYCISLDNLFISKNLITYLRNKSFFVTDITITKSGVLESMMKKKQIKKNQNIYEWGTLLQILQITLILKIFSKKKIYC